MSAAWPASGWGGLAGGAPLSRLTKPPRPAGGAWLTLNAMPCSSLMDTRDTSPRM